MNSVDANVALWGDYGSGRMQFTVQFPHDVDSIPRARRALDRVRGEVDDLTLRNARLLVSELVTNVVRHVDPSEGRDQIELAIERSDGRLRVEVADHGGGFEPAPRADRQDESSGWGLHILAQLAERWGVESDGGTRVWFELSVQRGHATTAG
jgi:anti-sigma regulatory factor (Ser/Thr protein kinase)